MTIKKKHQFSLFLRGNLLCRGENKIVLFKPKMTSAGFDLYLQQGAQNYEDSKESDLS